MCVHKYLVSNWIDICSMFKIDFEIDNMSLPTSNSFCLITSHLPLYVSTPPSKNAISTIIVDTSI